MSFAGFFVVDGFQSEHPSDLPGSAKELRLDCGSGSNRGPHRTSRPIRSVSVIGGGLMGAGIAAANVRHGLSVVLTDTDRRVLDSAPERIAAELGRRPEDVAAGVGEAAAWFVESPADETRMARCDLVLESIVENLAAKQHVYRRLERRLSEGTILASNTSTIPIARLAQGLARPERFCGIHFFHPVRATSLVEIIRGPKTSDETIARVVDYVRSIGKVPIVVADGPGFLVNRLLAPYLNEALAMLLDGASVEQIDRAATRFGMSMGPLRILDEIGLDTTMRAGRVLWEAFPDRIVPSPVLVTMLKRGRLGRKVGKGFYSYNDGVSRNDPPRRDPAVEAIVADWAGKPRALDDQAITDRLLAPMVLEASRLLEEERVGAVADVDLAVVLGLGFPTSHGGLLRWADTLGVARIVETLQSLAALSPHLEPTAMLRRMVADGGTFYS